MIREELKEYGTRAICLQDSRTGDHIYVPHDKAPGLRLEGPLQHSVLSLTSCIGGHAVAGNVAIYLPKGLKKGRWGESESVGREGHLVLEG